MYTNCIQTEICSAYQCKLCLSPFKSFNWVFFMSIVFQYRTHILHTTQSNCCTEQRTVKACVHVCARVCVHVKTYKLNSKYFTHLLLRNAAKSYRVRSSELPSHLRSAMPLKGCRLKASRLQSTIITLEVSRFRQDTSCGEKNAMLTIHVLYTIKSLTVPIQQQKKIGCITCI